MRFPSSNYTKMRLRASPRIPLRELTALPRPLAVAAGGEGLTVPSPKPQPPLSALQASSFRISALGLKEVVHPCISTIKSDPRLIVF